MSTLPQLLSAIDDTTNFQTLESFSDFAKDFLNFVSSDGLQADIVSRNEPNYHFFQYRENAGYAITRLINTDLFLTAEQFDSATQNFKYALRNIRDISGENELRKNINNYIYTCQQCIGCVLDTYNNQNKARKRNGLFFENLIKAVISFVGISATSVDEIISIADTDYTMKFQHDLVIHNANDEIKLIGQLKTSSKDRLDKIFLEKFMYNKLTQLNIPHIAIFLNDVQRKNSPQAVANTYGINSTFLPGHFNAYRVALNPLDGVYYFDLRPTMKTDAMLSPYIKSFDNFLVDDLWRFLE